MSTRRHSHLETTLARLSLGAVPMDGIYWIDPKAQDQSKKREQPELSRPDPVGTRWWRLIGRGRRPV
jgi:hypothetical protein